MLSARRVSQVSAKEASAGAACILLAGAYTFGLNAASILDRGDSSSFLVVKTAKNDLMQSATSNMFPESFRTKKSHQSTMFQINTSLEIKDENKKTRFARFLRDIHDLAREEEEATAKRDRTNLIQRISTVAGAENTENVISLRGTDLAKLSPTTAKEIINRLRSGNILERRSLVSLTLAARDILMKDPTLMDLRGKADRVTVVGDLHGSLSCLSSVLEIVGNLDDKSDDYVVLCGDYVDRGENGLEVLAILLLLKLAYPKNIVLLRGNHEDVMISSVYGFLDEVQAKYGGKSINGKGSSASWNVVWQHISNVFSALPVCAVTDSAFIVHGGIPSDSFALEDVARISVETRSKLDTIIEPRNKEEGLLEGMMWSDPSTKNGVRPNERGSGIEFGPDVAEGFLKRHGLKYIIRSHEPVEQGVDALQVGKDRYVVTVFSTANYPNGLGDNCGAVLDLNKAGDCLPKYFTYKENILMRHQCEDETNGPIYGEALRELIKDSRGKLRAAFRAIEQKHGGVTALQWAEVMAHELQLSAVPWLDVQPTMAPSLDDQVNASIDWKAFLSQYEDVSGNQDKLINIFRFMDVDGDGSVDRDEFLSGVDILNKRHLLGNKQIKNPKDLFEKLDVGKHGHIEIEEASRVLAHSSALSQLADTLDENQMEILKQNREMLLTAFKFLDKDRSGSIDRKEFQIGMELLNKRLPNGTQLKGYDEIFSMLDLDGNGEIDLEEFSHLFEDL